MTDPTAILDTPCKPGPTHSASVSKSRATNVACLFEQKAYACHTTNDESHRRRTDARSNACSAPSHEEKTTCKCHSKIQTPGVFELIQYFSTVIPILFEYFSTQRIFKRPSKPIMLSFFIGILLHFLSTIIIQLFNTSFVDTNTQINCIWQYIREILEYFKISVILSRRVLLRWRVLLRGTTGTGVPGNL